MSAGIRTMARLLRRAADAPASAAMIAAEGGLPRSSVFEVVARLEAAGLLRREAGRLVPGAAAVRLAFAAHGLARLSGPAEAILLQLRGETGAEVALVVDGRDVLRLSARQEMTAPLGLPVGGSRARVELCLRPNATRTERIAAKTALERARVSLEHYLDSAL